MSSEMKMKDMFGKKLPCRVCGEIIIFKEISNAEGDDIIETFMMLDDLTPKERQAVAHAVNTHDRLEAERDRAVELLERSQHEVYEAESIWMKDREKLLIGMNLKENHLADIGKDK